MKIMTCFIDASAWIAIIDKRNGNHQQARQYFEQLLENNIKIVTNNTAIDEAVNQLKKHVGSEDAKIFSKVIDESILTVKLRMDWISRRIRKNGIIQYIKSTDPDLELRHFFIYETIKRKKVDIIFSFDNKLKSFGFPLMPQDI